MIISNFYKDKSMVEYFYHYMNERHKTFVNRFILKKEKPWTTDEIIKNYKFTNLYKHLDRGTYFLLKEIIHNPSIKTREELVFNIFVYKWFNNIDTAIDLKLPIKLEEWDWPSFYEKCLQIQKSHPLFTSAHMVCGSNFSRTDWGKGAGSKPKSYIYVMNELFKHIVGVTKTICESESMESLFYILRKFNGVGNFLAYELVTDINYSALTDFDNMIWANPGPGCINGINWIFSNDGIRRTGTDWGKDYKKSVHAFRKVPEHQKIMKILMNDFKKKHPDVCNYQGMEFNMNNIEFNLCEFSKYSRALLGCGAPRNKFSHSTKEYVLDYSKNPLPLKSEEKKNKSFNSFNEDVLLENKSVKVTYEEVFL